MKILVTGGGGLIGSHSSELLVKRGHNVLVLDNFSTGRREHLAAFRGKVLQGDITDLACLEAALHDFKPEAVLHLAAQSAISISMKDPKKDLEINAGGTLNLLQMAKKYGVRRFVFASTSAVLDIPPTPYGISKNAAENYIRSMFPNYMILRYANVYGPRQIPLGENQVIARAFNHLIHGTEFKVTGHGCQKRDFVYVEDVAYCNFLALMCDTLGIFNVGTGESAMVNQVIAMINDIAGLPYEHVWEHTIHNDPRGDVHLDVQPIRRATGWSASVPLRDGLRRTLEWWMGQK